MTPGSVVQAQQVSYELHTLGWKAFQDLCLSVTSEVLGQTVQAFHPSHDGGRDGAFYGQWNPNSGENYSGHFTIQCKFTCRRNTNLSLRMLSDELRKARRLASKGLATYYLLMTNASVTGTVEEEVRSAFLAIPGIQSVKIFGAEWITAKIIESARLRMLVPRVYGLGDLSQIMDERKIQQSRTILHSMGDSLKTFVITDAYRKSALALRDHGFLMLLGEPASGKTTIAASLAIGAIDAFDSPTMKIHTPDEFVAHWNPNEPQQFFWVDDVFGATQYQHHIALEWSRIFPCMSAAIKKGARILFTSRDYIYRAALPALKLTEFPLLQEAQVIIHVQNLTEEEKCQILYNHIKLGTQSREFKRRIKQYLPAVAACRAFLPETARRLGNKFFTRNLALNQEGIMQFVTQPVQFLTEVLEGLENQHHAALALIFINGGFLPSPITLTPAEQDALRLLGGTEHNVQTALNALRDSLVQLMQGEERKWTFRHPTIGDAFASIVARNPELLDIYLRGTSTEKMLGEITCGLVEVHGAIIIIPESRYDLVIERLRRYQNQSRIYSFLAYRCNRTFIKRYIDIDHDIFDIISTPDSFLGISSEVYLLSRLHRYHLLPEYYRQQFVERVKELAIETPDTDFLTRPVVREILTESEVERILDVVAQSLLPVLTSKIQELKMDYSTDDGEPDDYFSSFTQALDTYHTAYSDMSNRKALIYIEEALKQIEDAVYDLTQENEWLNKKAEDEYPDDSIPSKEGEAFRNIFDDVDAE